MTSKAAIDDFLSQRRIAVIGASRSPRKFGNKVFRELQSRGYAVYPVNPRAREVGGQECYPDLTSLPERVDAAVLVVPPDQTEQVVRQAAEVGVRRIWMQQGAESEAAIAFCRERGLSVVHSACILMFLEPTAFFHRLHRWLLQVTGRLPQ